MVQLHLIAVGALGREMASRVSQMIEGVAITPVVDGRFPMPALWPEAGLHAIAAGRPVPTLAALVDDYSHHVRVPWVPLWVDHPFLQLGPVVVPGLSACFECYQRRALQHSPVADSASALLEHYRKNPQAEPVGYLPSVATVAASVLMKVVESIPDDVGLEAGIVRRFHLLTRIPTRAKAVGIHGCVRCGSGQDESTRTYKQLLMDLNIPERPSVESMSRGGQTG